MYEARVCVKNKKTNFSGLEIISIELVSYERFKKLFFDWHLYVMRTITDKYFFFFFSSIKIFLYHGIIKLNQREPESLWLRRQFIFIIEIRFFFSRTLINSHKVQCISWSSIGSGDKYFSIDARTLIYIFKWNHRSVILSF